MSLIRLLTAGRCWVGGKNEPSRYRVASQGMLPKFGGKKHPARETPRPETAAVSTGASLAATRGPEGPAPISPPARLIDEQPARPALAPECPTATKAPRNPAMAGQAWTAQSLSKVAGWFRGRAKPATPSVPHFAKPLVQAELSLDRIKVVRNDLSESDLEVVASKPPVVQTSTPPLKTVTRPGPAGRAWSRMGSQFFGAGKL